MDKNKNSDNHVVTPEMDKQIKLAQKLAEAHEVHPIFVSATFRTIAKQDLVSVSIPNLLTEGMPNKGAKFLKLVEGQKIMVFMDEKLQKLNTIEVKNHYVHGDFMFQLANGKKKPSVIRHFFVTPNYLGKTIAATVELKEKKCLLTGLKTIIIDVTPSLAGTYLVKHQLKLGAEVTGKVGEVKITGTDRCIRFEEVKAQRITNSDEPAVKAESKPANDNIIIEEAPTERKHRFHFKPAEKVEINQHLELKKKPGPTFFEIIKETAQGPQKIIHLLRN